MILSWSFGLVLVFFVIFLISPERQREVLLNLPGGIELKFKLEDNQINMEKYFRQNRDRFR